MSWYTEPKTADNIADDKVQRMIEGESIAVEKDEWPIIRKAMFRLYYKRNDHSIVVKILEFDEKFAKK